MDTDNLLLHAQHVEFAYESHPVLHGIDLALHPGDNVALLGPNGSGKTTLLRLLCAVLRPQVGRVLWQDRDLGALGRREIARHIALVPQELVVPFAFTVSEIVALGRTPHLRSFAGESRHDREAVEWALELTGTRPLADRYFGDLSGGERQRVVVAMALAQVGRPSADRRPSLLLLDEPTVHLDINHQIEVLDLIHRLNREWGLTVFATMHDLNLASLYFDRLVLLNAGTIVIEGPPREVLSKERVEDVFRADVMVQAHPTQGVPHIILLPSDGNGKG